MGAKGYLTCFNPDQKIQSPQSYGLPPDILERVRREAREELVEEIIRSTGFNLFISCDECVQSYILVDYLNSFLVGLGGLTNNGQAKILSHHLRGFIWNEEGQRGES